MLTLSAIAFPYPKNLHNTSQVHPEADEYLVSDDQGRSDEPARYFFELVHSLRVRGDIPLLIRDALFGEETLRRLAVRLGRLGVNKDFHHHLRCNSKKPTGLDCLKAWPGEWKFISWKPTPAHCALSLAILSPGELHTSINVIISEISVVGN